MRDSWREARLTQLSRPHRSWSELPWRPWRALIPWVVLLEAAAAIIEPEVVLAVFGILVIVDMIYCEEHCRR